ADSLVGPAEMFEAQKIVCTPVSSLTVRSPPFVNEGTSLTELTVMVKLCDEVSTPPLAVPPLSFKATVMTADPFALATDVKVSVPLESIAGPAENNAEFVLPVIWKVNV